MYAALSRDHTFIKDEVEKNSDVWLVCPADLVVLNHRIINVTPILFVIKHQFDDYRQQFDQHSLAIDDLLAVYLALVSRSAVNQLVSEYI